MKLFRLLAVSFVAMSLAGCCCGGRNVCTDPCDPCGTMMPGYGGGGGGGVGGSRLWPWNWFHRGYGYNNQCCCNCGCSGGCGPVMDCSCVGGCGAMDDGTYGTSCGCASNGMPSQLPMMGIPSSPMTTQPVYSVPRSPSEQVPSSIQAPEPPQAPSPTPTNNQTTMIPPSAGFQTQTVSYEEFQRLPGTIISGPGAIATGAPVAGQQIVTKSQPMLAPPAPSFTSMPRSNVAAQNRQALWVSAQGN